MSSLSNLSERLANNFLRFLCCLFCEWGKHELVSIQLELYLNFMTARIVEKEAEPNSLHSFSISCHEFHREHNFC